MEHPGQYVTMTSAGSVGNPVHAGPNDKNAQFFVRVKVRDKFHGIFSVHALIKSAQEQEAGVRACNSKI